MGQFEPAINSHNTHLRRKAYTAIAAKMTCTVYAVVKGGEPALPSCFC
jgi:hypothetical protein